VEILEDRHLLAVIIHELPIPSSTGPIVSAPDGALWFTLKDAQIGRMTTAGELATFDAGVPLTGGIAATSSSSIWFTTVGNQIGRFVLGSGVRMFDTPDGSGSSSPWRLAAGPDGNVWFTENSSSKIGRVTDNGNVTEFALPTANAGPLIITDGPDGNLWFTESLANQIGRITPAGKITEFAIPPPGGPGSMGSAAPTGISTGPDGNIWFTEQSRGIGRITPAGQITEFKVPTTNVQPYAIAAGPDGNIWFTEFTGNRVGRITPAGLVTEYTIPDSSANPAGIVAGGDGNIWFTENARSNLGRLGLVYADLGITIGAQPVPVTARELLTYTITVTNPGPNEATNVSISDPFNSLLSSASLVSAVASQGTITGLSYLELADAIVAHIGTLHPGGIATLTIVVRPITTAVLNNRVFVQADESDPGPGDNVSHVAITVLASSSTAPPGGTGSAPVPVFTSEQRIYTGVGKRRKLAGFQLNFSGPLDLPTAAARSHYHLTQPGRTKKAAPKLIAIRALAISSNGLVVKVTPGKYDAHKAMTLTITGLRDREGRPLASNVIRL
jgi:streptogramin lyase